MPDFTFKNAFFRIFWKILAKTGPQTLYSYGFPEASVEMKVAPFRALTHPHDWIGYLGTLGGNEGRPIQGIDTYSGVNSISILLYCGNEGRPFQGIDTS